MRDRKRYPRPEQHNARFHVDIFRTGMAQTGLYHFIVHAQEKILLVGCDGSSPAISSLIKISKRRAFSSSLQFLY